jgi:phosphinothricin acetyltransferase
VPGDLTEVAGIYSHYVRETVITFDETAPSLADWEHKFDDLGARGLPFLVAEVDGEVAGFAYAGPYRPKPGYRHTVEDTIYLRPEHTGRGLGRALLGALLPRCAEAGARQVIAIIADTGNGASQALHRGFGYAEAGRLREVGFKHGRWIDTVFMQRALT